MADTTVSTAAPVMHGPVTLAIRALAAEHGPRINNVVPLSPLRRARMPSFTPLDYSFPLDDATWSRVYLYAVRYAAHFVNLSGRQAVEECVIARSQSASTAGAMDQQFAATIAHLEELTELLRVGRQRIRDAHAVAARIEIAEVRQ